MTCSRSLVGLHPRISTTAGNHYRACPQIAQRAGVSWVCPTCPTTCGQPASTPSAICEEDLTGLPAVGCAGTQSCSCAATATCTSARRRGVLEAHFLRNLSESCSSVDSSAGSVAFTFWTGIWNGIHVPCLSFYSMTRSRSLAGLLPRFSTTGVNR